MPEILTSRRQRETDSDRRRLPRTLAVVLCLAGISLNALLVLPGLHYILHGDNDFLAFYAGSALAGSPDLYNQQAVQRVQAPHWQYPRNIAYMRLPFYAAMIRPLHWFPFQSAYWVWQGFSLLSFLLFLVWWPEADRGLTAVACCWSLPLLNCFIMGQDLMFVMLLLAVSMTFLFRGKPFAAGCIWSLCFIKYNLFLTLPLLIVRKRLWKLAGGMTAGGVVLLAVSFAVGGWSWPVSYMAMLRLPTSTPYYSGLPNLHGLFSGKAHGVELEALGGILVLAASWAAMKNDDLRVGIGAILTSGLLLSYHAFLADAFVMVPAVLLFLSQVTNSGYKLIAFVLILPFACWQFIVPAPLFPPVALFLAILLLMAALEYAPPTFRRRLSVAA